MSKGLSWTPKQAPDTVKFVDHLAPGEVLYFFDQPLVFTTSAPDGRLFLCLVVEEFGRVFRCLVAPTDRACVASLRDHNSPLLDAIGKSRLWLVEMDEDLVVRHSWDIGIDQVPPSMLPQQGVGIRPDAPPTPPNDQCP